MGEKIYELSELIEYLKELEAKIKKLEADRNEWKSLYEDLHKLHADGKLDNSDKLLKENQRLREASTPIVKFLSEKGEISSDLIRDLQKALEK